MNRGTEKVLRQQRKMGLSDQGGDGFSEEMCLGKKVPNFAWDEKWHSWKREQHVPGHGGGESMWLHLSGVIPE